MKDYEKVELKNSINEILGRVDIESSLYRFWNVYSEKYDENVYLVFEDIEYENNYNNTVNIKGIFRIDTSDKSLLFEDEFTFNNILITDSAEDFGIKVDNYVLNELIPHLKQNKQI
ncbi:hypothetical protein [Staphylococcus phage vB_StaM_PB50]|nr:hypothetical protein [Staphylococcus phage vB_StaM_PB50]